ncbi:MAG: DegT/DnrJ/EryC1/StrS family aminotransferase [Pseudomonadota bacterium]
MRSDYLVYGEPVIGDDEIAAVEKVMRSGWLGTGPKVFEFEKAFAEYKQSEHAVAVNSCTAALHLSMLASGVGTGDEVITTAMTFCASVNAIIHAGATPVLVDVDPSTQNIDAASIKQAITPKTKAILLVHYAGRPCDLESLVGLAEQHDLKLIEDCAHAVEATYKGRPVGTFGDFGCFSFYVTKNLTTVEGGMVISKHEKDAARIKILALHGMSRDAWRRYSDEGYRHYKVCEVGFKYNMTDLVAAIGIQQLRAIETNWHKRSQLWTSYREQLSSSPLGLPPLPEPDTRHAFHLFTVRVDAKQCGISRDTLMNALNTKNIGVGVHYLSIPEHPAYQELFHWKPEEYPHAHRYGQETLSLPLSPSLTERDVEDVVSAIASSLSG